MDEPLRILLQDDISFISLLINILQSNFLNKFYYKISELCNEISELNLPSSLFNDNNELTHYCCYYITTLFYEILDSKISKQKISRVLLTICRGALIVLNFVENLNSSNPNVLQILKFLIDLRLPFPELFSVQRKISIL